MRKEDLAKFTKILDAACALLSRGNYTPNATSTAIWFRALQQFDLATVQSAFDAHVRDPQRGRYVPTPADIIAQIEGTAAADGRPGPEEAWAIALRSRDEQDTVVWTREIAEALGIAKPILDMRDEVGARMAFKEAYNRLVDDARRQLMPTSWEVSLGFDPKRRIEAMRAAVETGRLPHDAVREAVELGRLPLDALPAPDGEAVPLLSLADSPRVPQHIREELKRLSDSLRAGPDKPSLDAKARAETEARRADLMRRTEEYAREHGTDLTVQPAPPVDQQQEQAT